MIILNWRSRLTYQVNEIIRNDLSVFLACFVVGSQPHRMTLQSAISSIHEESVDWPENLFQKKADTEMSSFTSCGISSDSFQDDGTL